MNAMTIKEGGGAVVFTRTFNEMLRQTPDIHWIVVIDNVLNEKIQVSDQVTILTFPWVKKSPLHLLYWNEIVLPKIIRNKQVDCVYSQINTLPFRKLPCPAFLSILQAGYFSKEFIALNAKYNNTLKQKIGWGIRKKWVFSSIKKADKITVPTQALANEIIAQLKIDKNKVSVILPGIGLAEGRVDPKFYPKQKTWRIGYITKFGVQKNFEVLFHAAAQLKSKQIDFKIILTLNENTNTFKQVNKLIEKYNIAALIENHGELADKAIRELYITLDLFVFPSLCESIGFTLLEAMHYRLPIIAASILSNHELLGEKGLFFQPHDADQLTEKIVFLMESEKQYLAMSDYSIERSDLFSWKKSAMETLEILNTF